MLLSNYLNFNCQSDLIPYKLILTGQSTSATYAGLGKDGFFSLVPAEATPAF